MTSQDPVVLERLLAAAKENGLTASKVREAVRNFMKALANPEAEDVTRVTSSADEYQRAPSASEWLAARR